MQVTLEQANSQIEGYDMNNFEPGEYVRLRSGGRKMQVMQTDTSEAMPASPLVACEYRAKSRRILGFYAAHSLVHAHHPKPDEPTSANSAGINASQGN
ncbi:hypothetical protein [Pseudomonas viridiflava]|uniref:hypothetical protein n=1 Tax=Pseudomonas viridiflava TaxID=33069 RepID=UPI000EFB7EB5|nr:hypothetical protein [Pseudomonas viridiflava]